MLATLKRAIRNNPRAYKLASRPLGLWRGVVGLARGRRGARDHVLSTLSLAARSTRVLGRPMNVTIEPTNVCNLECPVCETGAGILGRPGGHMTLEQFRTIVDRVAPHTNTLLFYFMGEPFMNRHAYEMIRYAKRKGIPFVTTCTNGDPVDPEQLVDCGIDEVSFQIGGMTQQTHQAYRVNSRLERVMANLERTVRVRDARRPAMRIEAGFILMKHNEHEVEPFVAAMRRLGVRPNVIDPCVRTVEQGRQMLPSDRAHWYYDPQAFEQGVLRPRMLPDNDCPWIYYSITVQVNGDVVPCCRDPKGLEVVGNLLSQSLDEVWNGARYRAFRERLLKDQGGIEICRLCSAYGVSAIQ
jgi:radical SAM protein with 4Fe4S-binding SPASM domain